MHQEEGQDAAAQVGVLRQDAGSIRHSRHGNVNRCHRGSWRLHRMSEFLQLGVCCVSDNCCTCEKVVSAAREPAT
jgi:hypothetical protein